MKTLKECLEANQLNFIRSTKELVAAGHPGQPVARKYSQGLEVPRDWTEFQEERIPNI